MKKQCRYAERGVLIERGANSVTKLSPRSDNKFPVFLLRYLFGQ